MSTHPPTPVGRREERDGHATVVIERTFRAPMEDVWAAVTEPERLVRWIGTWSGDPASGTVQFRMTAEAEDIEAEPVTVHECDPPRRLVLSWASRPPATGPWEVELGLTDPLRGQPGMAGSLVSASATACWSSASSHVWSTRSPRR
ncbi:MAG TPA: SRPBCC domain-containing protein [Ornithinibacter sp.]|nr:SRPBCC domain-containing protein [Ornithinibacter sp.]